MSSEKTPREIAEEIVKKCSCTFEDFIDEKVNGMPMKPEFDVEIAKAIEQERSKRLSWPSQEEIEKEYNSLPQTQGAHFGWSECLFWLRSQVKPFEMPSFTDEEVTKMAYTYNNAVLFDDGFIQGFKTALELVRKKMGDV